MNEEASSSFDERMILHRGNPFIIFSRTPLQKGMDKNEAVLINLASCEKEQDLGKVIDILFSVIRLNDMDKLEGLRQALQPPKENSKAAIKVWDHINQTVELKPNFFGIGINFNYLLQKLAEMVLAKNKKS